jgi:hypothetical protein
LSAASRTEERLAQSKDLHFLFGYVTRARLQPGRNPPADFPGKKARGEAAPGLACFAGD